MYGLTVDDGGRVALPQRVVARLRSHELRLQSHSPAHLTLVAQGGGEPCLTVTLGELGVADVLSFLNMFRKTGVLYLELADGARQIFFQEGEIIFALSERVEEDLGETLCQTGRLDRATLAQVRSELTGEWTLAQLLVKKNLVAPRDLWLATRYQVETIVYGLFASDQQGGACFVAGDPGRDDIVRLSMSTQNLIMEGLRRVDERALYLRRLRSFEAQLSYSGRSPTDLAEEEKRLLSFIYGAPATVADLVVRSGLAEFDALRLLYQLAEKKMVDVAAAAPAPLAEDVAELVELFNELLRLLCQAVAQREFTAELQQALRVLPSPLRELFRGVVLAQDGSVDGRQLMRNLTGLEGLEQKRLLVDALSELVYLACGQARRLLGSQASGELTSRVQELVRRAQRLVAGGEEEER
ncbi:DUF4388 domain-containing protein [Desulfuromonas thiophila]|uniref:DUF4388 domain-containing protein n=1 Tax=Desulfuromonas thiophila TaxID=57664 RepID=UPI0024A9FA31|nr:DUF4388 domain-containing protein [Desulfuromonas thiophila]